MFDGMKLKKKFDMMESGKGYPRHNFNNNYEQNKDAYIGCYLYVHDILLELSDTIINMKQDYPSDEDLNHLLEQREFLKRLLVESSEMIKYIAGDFAADRTFDKERWRDLKWFWLIALHFNIF